MTRSRLFGLISTLTASSLLTAALWVEPITNSFTLGGHLAVSAVLAIATTFFVAVFLDL